MKVSEILQKVKSYTQKRNKNSTNSESDYTDCDNDFAKCVEKYTVSEEEYQKALEEWENSDCLVHEREKEIADADSQMIEEILVLAKSVYPNEEDWNKYNEKIDEKLNQCFSDGMLTSVELLLWLTNLKTDLENANKSQVDLSQQIILKKKQKIGNKKKEDEELDL